jgi:hypothetical protein
MIDEAMKAHLQTILADGIQKGNRPNVFAKIGDSITDSPSLLKGFGCGEGDFGAFPSLKETVAYFSEVTFPASYSSVRCETANSFTRDSVSTFGGWRACQQPHNKS